MEQEILTKETSKNGTPQNPFPKSDITEKMITNDEIGKLISDFRDFKANANKNGGVSEVNNNNQEYIKETDKSKDDQGKSDMRGCFFLRPADLNILMNITNFQGVSIYIGHEKGEEVIILVPVTKRSDPENVFTQDSTLNGVTKTTSTVVMLDYSKTPCPPPKPPATTCS